MSAGSDVPCGAIFPRLIQFRAHGPDTPFRPFVLVSVEPRRTISIGRVRGRFSIGLYSRVAQAQSPVPVRVPSIHHHAERTRLRSHGGYVGHVSDSYGQVGGRFRRRRVPPPLPPPRRRRRRATRATKRATPTRSPVSEPKSQREDRGSHHGRWPRPCPTTRRSTLARPGPRVRLDHLSPRRRGQEYPRRTVQACVRVRVRVCVCVEREVVR